MKRKMYLLLVMIATATVFVSYGQNNNGTSSYWNDAYRQKYLNGKVKTVKTFKNGSAYSCDYLEFDSNGNLLKDGTMYPSDESFSGYVYFYDSQNRVTKVMEMYQYDTEPYSTIEFGYDSSPHNIYVPTNYYDMIKKLDFGDLRLKKGITSIYYTYAGEVWLDIKCTSVSGDHLTFSATVGKTITNIFGNFDKIEADCQGNYITNLKFMNQNTLNFEEITTVGNDGMPVKMEIAAKNGSMITDFATIAGFLQRTKMYSTTSTQYFEWRYNDKGHNIYMGEFKNGAYIIEISFTYEYDSQGNWIKQVETDDDGTITTYTREYTYYDTPPTNIPVLQAETFAYLNGKTLNIQSPNAETVKVYSMSGALLYSFQKPAGLASYPVNPSKGTVLIMKGSAGWVKKVIVN